MAHSLLHGVLPPLLSTFSGIIIITIVTHQNIMYMYMYTHTHTQPIDIYTQPIDIPTHTHTHLSPHSKD